MEFLFYRTILYQTKVFRGYLKGGINFLHFNYVRYLFSLKVYRQRATNIESMSFRRMIKNVFYRFYWEMMKPHYRSLYSMIGDKLCLKNQNRIRIHILK